jgi:hypothetical protein
MSSRACSRAGSAATAVEQVTDLPAPESPYLIKLELLRRLYRGVHAHLIDPEAEFTRLATTVGGTIIRPGAPGVRFNPFELPVYTDPGTRARTAAPDALRRRQMFLHTFLAVVLGQPSIAAERAVPDTATNRRAGITDEPSTWTRPASLLRDLHATLRCRGSSGAPVPRAAPGAIRRSRARRAPPARRASAFHPCTPLQPGC